MADFTLEEDVNSKVMLFISRLRSENTRNGAKTIINLLLQARKEDFPGWVKSSDIFSALKLNPATTTRLLNDLNKANVIIKHSCPKVEGQRGSPRVFYRVPEYYDPNQFLSREELIQRLNEYHKLLSQSIDREQACQYLFKQFTGQDPQPLIKEVIKEMEKEKEEQFKKISETGIKIPDPCKSL